MGCSNTKVETNSPVRKTKDNKHGNVNKSIITLPLSFRVTLRERLKIKESDADIWITDCITFKDKYIFINRNTGLVIREADRNIRNITLSGNANGLSAIDDATVAVTFPNGHYIEIICVATGEVKNKIEVDGMCFQVAYRNGLLYVGFDEKIEEIDLTGKTIRRVPSPTADIGYIAATDEKLFVTDLEKNLLYCCDFTGLVLWEFEDRKLEWPMGVTTDNDGNVYVVGSSSHNVLVISPDGKHHRELLNESNGLKDPIGIHYDKTNNRLLVCNKESGDAFLLEIENVY
ncbi:uncharacterized protein LOC134693130 [Mytilus trossulus]|uniref:uncharacterized protein LOC134693130 n=1 Tax=Mytilus trossulus TaxID=6551 RepID=UPI0030043EED